MHWCKKVFAPSQIPFFNTCHTSLFQMNKHMEYQGKKINLSKYKIQFLKDNCIF